MSACSSTCARAGAGCWSSEARRDRKVRAVESPLATSVGVSDRRDRRGRVGDGVAVRGTPSALRADARPARRPAATPGACAARRPRSRVRGTTGSVPRRPWDADAPCRRRRRRAVSLHHRGRPVAGRRIPPGPRVRGPPAARGAGGARIRRARSRPAAELTGLPNSSLPASRRRTPAPCSPPSSRAGSMIAFATGSSPRPEEIRWRAGAPARTLVRPVGRRVRDAGPRPSVGQDRGELPAAARGASPSDAGLAPARGRGTGRRPRADVARRTRLGIPATTIAPAAEEGLLDVGPRFDFGIRWSGRPFIGGVGGRAPERPCSVGRITDAELEPDRRAWHRAQASGPGRGGR